MSDHPTVIIYRNHLLRHSETFIQAQAESLSQFDYHYAGSRQVLGLDLPSEKVSTIYGPQFIQKVHESAYRISGFSPFFFRKIRSLSPELIHAHFGPDAVRAIPLAKALDVPLLVTFHGYDITVKPSYAWRASFSQLIYLLHKEKLKQEATHFIAVSDFIRKLLVEQKFPPEKISTHYIGINPSLFSQDENIQRTPTVLFVGRLVEMKGCEYLIRAMAQVQAVLPDTELVIIGDGPLRSQLELMAGQNLRSYRFLGFQSPSIVQDWMNKSKVFCVPSITTKTGHSEAFGIVFAEAQSMGLPAVSFDTGGISEAVAHGSTGLLAPQKDVKELSMHLVSLLTDEALWRRMSRAAAKRVREKFDIRHQSKLLEKIYSKAIA
ncbi:MAG: glycosyltransferase [Cyanobacteria bacterium J06581_3]